MKKIQIGLVKPHDWIGEGIVEAEKIDSPGDKEYFSHAFIKIIDGDENVTEAEIDGVVKEEWEKTKYYTNELKYMLCEIFETLSEKQTNKIIKKTMSLVGRKYDIPSLLFFFPVRIVLNRLFSFKPLSKFFNLIGLQSDRNTWIGKTGKAAEKYLFCSEVVTIAINEGVPGFFTYKNSRSPQDIYHFVGSKLKCVYKNY